MLRSAIVAGTGHICHKSNTLPAGTCKTHSSHSGPRVLIRRLPRVADVLREAHRPRQPWAPRCALDHSRAQHSVRIVRWRDAAASRAREGVAPAISTEE